MQYMRTFRIISFSKDPTGTPVLEDSKKIPPTFRTSQSVSSVAQSCPTLCDPMDCSRPGFPVHHQLPQPSQTHAHRVGDAIQPSPPLPSPSPPAFNLPQHQGLSQWVSSSTPRLSARKPRQARPPAPASFSAERSVIIPQSLLGIIPVTHYKSTKAQWSAQQALDPWEVCPLSQDIKSGTRWSCRKAEARKESTEFKHTSCLRPAYLPSLRTPGLSCFTQAPGALHFAREGNSYLLHARD